MKIIKCFAILAFAATFTNAHAQQVSANVNGVNTVLTTDDAGTAGLLVTSTMNKDLALGTRGNNGLWYNRMRIMFQTGNVGISTNNPTERLHVIGQTRTNGLKIDGTGVLELGLGLTKEDNAGKICYGCFTGESLNIVGGGTTSANRKIKFWSEGGMEIGAPIVNLSSNATLKFADRGEIMSGDNNHRIRFHRPENIMEFLEFGEIVFSTGATSGVSTNRAIISRDGSLGLGTMTPSQKLQVEGNSYLNGVVGINRAPDANIALAVKGSLDVKNSSDNTVFHVSSGKQLVFVGTDAYSKYQTATANGLINTNDYSLWVSKGVNAQDFAMSDVSEWNDFVFDKKYQLPSLKETEAYIQANKHLPYIPSEAEVVKKGYSLHSLNRGFLQTIEELTLHSIAQEKKITAQESVLNEQAAQIKKLASELAEIKALLQRNQ